MNLRRFKFAWHNFLAVYILTYSQQCRTQCDALPPTVIRRRMLLMDCYWKPIVRTRAEGAQRNPIVGSLSVCVRRINRVLFKLHYVSVLICYSWINRSTDQFETLWMVTFGTQWDDFKINFEVWSKTTTNWVPSLN